MAYRGWQRQAGVVSVQETLETALTKVLKTPVTVNGCGRTDAQVHASQFFFHADLPDDPDSAFQFKLNNTLPPDISVYDLVPVHEQAHARFDAFRRTYDYFIHTEKNQWLHGFSAFYPVLKVDWQKVNAASQLLTQYNDFYAFCKSPDAFNHTRCNVSRAQWQVDKPGARFRFQISSNRFLQGMVRILVRRMLEVGAGNLSLEEFELQLARQRQPRLLNPAYPQGLYLSKIEYPYLVLRPRAPLAEFVGSGEGEVWYNL